MPGPAIMQKCSILSLQRGFLREFLQIYIILPAVAHIQAIAVRIPVSMQDSLFAFIDVYEKM